MTQIIPRIVLAGAFGLALSAGSCMNEGTGHRTSCAHGQPEAQHAGSCAGNEFRPAPPPAPAPVTPEPEPEIEIERREPDPCTGATDFERC